jgi:predicted component of type VI protein secretion system
MSEDNLVLRVRLSLKGRPIKSYAFQQDVITIGRDPEADIFLDNPGISREHVRIEKMPNGHFCLKDLGSANGTFLNDEPVQSAMIYSSDVLRIGKFSLWLGIDRDRRMGDRPIEVRRAYSEFAPETMMLSTEELDRLMKSSRDPATPARATRTPEPNPARTPVPTPIATQVATSVAAPVPQKARSRGARNLVGIGLIVIIATSLGAGFAWLFLR